tara:strand:+ start:819 stop:1115 length:297 start_codon:yes stop_codon:yes gene_type:complete
MIFLLYGCQAPYQGSGYSTSSSSTWSSNYSTYTSQTYVKNELDCDIFRELEDINFAECMYSHGYSYSMCKKYSKDLTSLSLDQLCNNNTRNSGSRSTE